MADSKHITRGRVGRLVTLASAGIQSTAGKLIGRETAVALQQTADVLGSLRGLATKVGQMTSYVDGLAPEEQSELYSNVLGKLLADAPSSPPHRVRETLEAELREIAIARGMKTLREDGIYKALQGITTLEEVLARTAE